MRLQSTSPTPLLSCLLAILFMMPAQADIYTWVDKDGKVHYTDQKHKAQTNTEKVEIDTFEVSDKYTVPSVEEHTPLEYSSSEPNRTVAITEFILGLEGASSSDILIGRVTCGNPIDLYWAQGPVDLTEPESAQPIVTEFNKYGYATDNQIAGFLNPAQLSLTAEIAALKINTCPQDFNRKFTKNSSYVRIKWKLRDPMSGELLYSGETKGGHNALKKPALEDGGAISISEAFRSATRNLLADQAFTKLLKPIDPTQLKSSFSEVFEITLNYGSGKDSFRNVAEANKRNSVIIKTKDGHGSGVVVNNEGFVLTNAHVVGDQKNVKVVVNNTEYDAVVVRKDNGRDVAILQAQQVGKLLRGVKVASDTAVIGDEIYVVGAPLSVKNSQTVTKGVVSAYRTIDGVPFIQTDAAINLGNSGGPVFNSSGELIALTVSGMFTREGANLSINYLIPIDDALQKLAITNVTHTNSIVDKLASFSKSSSDNSVQEGNDYKISTSNFGWLMSVYQWLNAPAF